jgi:hypothetical protein
MTEHHETTTAQVIPIEAAPRRWRSWGDVFRHYLNRGHDHADAAYRADEWERRA